MIGFFDYLALHSVVRHPLILDAFLPKGTPAVTSRWRYPVNYSLRNQLMTGLEPQVINELAVLKLYRAVSNPPHLNVIPSLGRATPALDRDRVGRWGER